MSGFGAYVDSEHTEPWVAQVGKFMLNFGSIEHLSYFWIAELRDRTPIEALLSMTFSKRIQRIGSLLKASRLSPPLVSESRKAWDAARRLSKIRNDIAHSPILFGWHDKNHDRPPDFIACFNIQRLKQSQQELRPLLEYQTLYDAVDETATLTLQLFRLLNRVTEELGPES